MNKKNVCERLLGIGFRVTNDDGRIIEAVRYDMEKPNEGIRMTCFFGKRTNKGRMLESINLYVFPIFGNGGMELNGLVKRNYEAGKEIASCFPCPVSAITTKPIIEFNQTGE